MQENIYTSLCNWVKNLGYNYLKNKNGRGGISMGNKLPDAIAFNEQSIISFEIKKYANEVTTAIGQCMSYLKESNYSYIVLPSDEVRKVRVTEIIKDIGIGLIGVGNDYSVKVFVEPLFFNSKTYLVTQKINRTISNVTNEPSTNSRFGTVRIRNISGCLGITLPKAICEIYGFNVGDELEIVKFDYNKIILKKVNIDSDKEELVDKEESEESEESTSVDEPIIENETIEDEPEPIME